MKPKRRMVAFEIDEISTVDLPAMEGALATIRKRRAATTPLAAEVIASAILGKSRKVSETHADLKPKPKPKDEDEEEEEKTMSKFPLDPTEKEFKRTVKAIQNFYHCLPADAEQSAQLFYSDEAVFKRMSPKVLPALKAIAEQEEQVLDLKEVAKVVDDSRGEGRTGRTLPDGTVLKYKGPNAISNIDALRTVRRKEDEEGGYVAKQMSSAFVKRVTEVQARDKCSRNDAMRKARHEFPAEYDLYRGV